MRRAVAAVALVLAAVLIAPAVSSALDGPQAEYRSKVEPICQAEGEAMERLFPPRRVPVDDRTNELKRAGRKFVKAAKLLGGALEKLRSVPRPEADARRLVKWLDQVSDQVKRLRQAGKAAIAVRPGQAQKLINQFAYASSRANNLVVSYEFRHCVFKEAGFTP
jgi:hypothetical protein